jgi:hypothetical protein
VFLYGHWFFSDLIALFASTDCTASPASIDFIDSRRKRRIRRRKLLNSGSRHQKYIHIIIKKNK